jgi:hypothetical protein
VNVIGYEFGIQYREDPDHDWQFYWTNKFGEDTPYPSVKSVKNAMAQIKNPPKYSYRNQVPSTREYRIVSRPYGAWEDFNG